MREFSVAMLLFCASVAASAQTLTTNPYSKMGFGLTERPGDLANPGMGGVATGLFRKNALNVGNPASVSAIDTLTFVLEFGMRNNMSLLTGEGTNSLSADANFNYFAFGFRGNKHWSLSMGATPLTSRGYTILDREKVPNVGDVEKYYVGSGGLNQLFMSNSFDITPDFSAGVKVSYLFGKLEECSTLKFPGMPGAYTTQEGIKRQVSDVDVQLGAHYRLRPTEERAYGIGVTFSPAMKISANENRIKGTTTGDEIASADNNSFLDTLFFVEGDRATFDKPMSFSLGLFAVEHNHFEYGVDYTYENWSATGHSSVRDAHRVAAGFSRVPQWNSVLSYGRRMTYRGGLYFERTCIDANGGAVLDLGLGAGLGLPIRKGLYNLDVDLQLGRMAPTTSGGIAEMYGKMTVKIRFREFWFYKAKYD